MSAERLTCIIEPVGPGDATLASNVRADLIGRGVVVGDRPAGGFVAPIVLGVCVELSESACALVERLAERCHRVLVVVGRLTTASGIIWRLLARGAADVLCWRGNESGAEILCRLQRWNRIDSTVNAPFVRDHLVGQSKVWLGVLRRVVEIASFTSSPLLLTGESGHRQGARGPTPSPARRPCRTSGT